MADQELIRNQHESRTSNHPYSQQSKAPHARTLPFVPIEVGDIVYLVADKNKIRGHDRYLVVATDGPWCSISKFTGSQLCATAHRVKKSACFKVPPHTLTATTPTPRALDFEEDLPADTPDPPPDLPAIPPQLSTPNVAPCQPTPANGREGGLPVQSAPPPHPWSQAPRSPPLKHHLTWHPLPRLIRAYADLNVHDALPCTSLTMKSIIPDIHPPVSIIMDTWLLRVGSPTPCIVLLFVVCSFWLCSCRCKF